LSGRRPTTATSATSSLSSAKSPAFGAALSMRSPVVGRRRRRSSANDGMSTGMSTGPGPSPRLGLGVGGAGLTFGTGAGTDIDIEGLLRGSRRRRIHTEGDGATSNDLEGDHRMEVGLNESSS
jgi:hypothetical protein